MPHNDRSRGRLCLCTEVSHMSTIRHERDVRKAEVLQLPVLVARVPEEEEYDDYYE